MTENVMLFSFETEKKRETGDCPWYLLDNNGNLFKKESMPSISE